jgi:hypothetical protein
MLSQEKPPLSKNLKQLEAAWKVEAAGLQKP